MVWYTCSWMKDWELVELIYAGLTDSREWQRFLDGFRGRLRASQAILAIAYPEETVYSMVLSSGMSDDDRRELAQWGPESDPWVSRIDWATATPGEFRASQDICPDELLESSPMYSRLLGPRGWHYGGGILLASSAVQKAMLTSTRPKALGPLNAEEVGLHHFLSPHLVRAVRLHDERLRMKAEQSSARALLDSAGTALLLLSEKGQIRLANAPAQRLLEDRGLIHAERGHLRANDPALNTKLHELIGRVGLPLSQVNQGSLVLANDAVTLWATASRLARPGDSPLAAEAPAVALSLTDPTRRPRLIPEPLQRLYGLTPAEAHVALQLADGLSAEEIALRTGVMLDTTRTHIKRSLSKMACNRQGELVALVLRAARAPMIEMAGV